MGKHWNVEGGGMIWMRYLDEGIGWANDRTSGEDAVIRLFLSQRKTSRIRSTNVEPLSPKLTQVVNYGPPTSKLNTDLRSYRRVAPVGAGPRRQQTVMLALASQRLYPGRGQFGVREGLL